VGKLPEEFTQADLDDYLQSMLRRKPLPAEAQFKHFIYGLKCYLNTLGYKELPGLVLPAIRRDKKLPRVRSTEDVRTLLHCCELYTKSLFSIIYDCGLRAFEACNLKWTDIDIHRKMVHIKQRLDHRSIQTTMTYLHVARIEKHNTAWATLRKFFAKQGLKGGMTGILHTC
jgi:integrase